MDVKYVSKLSSAVDYGTGIFLLVIAAFTILGNSAVLITAARRLSKLKPPEYLTVNLAVTDIGMALSMYPLSIASAFNHAWVGGDSSCIYYGTMGFLFSLASIVTLTVMAVVRCFLTRTSRCTGNKFDKRTIFIFIFCIWLYATIWALLPLMGWGHYGPEPFGLSCSVDWAGYHNSLNGSSFIVCMFVLCTLLPCLTITVSYSGIVWKLHKAYRAIQNSETINHSRNMENKYTLMAVLISGGFIVWWTPYVTVSFWTIFNSSNQITPTVSLLPCLFAKSSTAYNPFIYYIFSKSFRREIKKLRCRCGLHFIFSNADSSVVNHLSAQEGIK
ncbi:opsin-5-like isoform X1 [Acipenser oxyrinchus oxyrinchus]|uniref:Opsin-5-like isoform X1 n=1 Tax=Acipenser oxyrinchus oxyrinchus TaxID=40147 RepID=A0AAD8GCG2_ACIOX|nr:opsin-5-like isoform X1 [Acipenser oxyrinchus oxyrinchus]